MSTTTTSAIRAAATAATLASTAFVMVDSAPKAFAAPMTYVVDTTSDNPADGFTLREAVTDANANAGTDTIEFADGLAGTITLASGELTVTDGLVIDGPGSEQLTIDGADTSRIFNISGAGTGFIMDGATIANGATLGSGGGIAVSGGDEVILNDVDFVDNSASTQGGGLWITNPNAAVEIANSHFDTNTSGDSGGGIYVNGAGADSVELRNLSVENNRSVNGNGGGVFVSKPGGAVAALFVDARDNEATNGSAGGLWLDGAGLEVADSTIADNAAGLGFGGATINSNVGDAAVVRSTFSGNTAMDSGAGNISSASNIDVIDSTFEKNTSPGLAGVQLGAVGGEIDVLRSRFLENTGGTTGALYVSGAASLQIIESTVDANSGTDHGGLYVATTPTSIERSTFSRNTADPVTGTGGAIYSTAFSPIESFNSTFHDNSAFEGGAIHILGGTTVDLTHTTMTDNTATGEGGGVYLVAGSNASIKNSIVVNEAPTYPDVNDATLDIDHSILGDGSAIALNGSGFQVGVDPKLRPLADNGGPTQTRMPSLDSPAIGNGNAPLLIALPFLDQRGRDRGLAPFDMGSVEVAVGDNQIWVPVEPGRYVDTRGNGETIDNMNEATGAFGDGEQRTITFAGRGDVPADARGVIANITAVNPTANGFVTAHPCVNPRPNIASLNYTAGVNLGNEVILDLDMGDACLYTSDQTEITVDVVGYIPADSLYSSVEPARYADTRENAMTFDGAYQGGGGPGAGAWMTVAVGGRGNVPADAEAAVLYVAAVNPAAAGFVTVWDCEGDAPLASSLNHVAGVNRGNEIVAEIGVSGNVCLFTSADIDLTVDVVGFVPPFTNFDLADAPSRLLDTRPGESTVDGQAAGEGLVGAGESVELTVAGRAGIPGLATTVAINVTAVGPAEAGFVTVYDCNDLPLASSLNYVPGVNGGNEIIASVNAGGKLCLYTSADTHLTADVTGWTSL